MKKAPRAHSPTKKASTQKLRSPIHSSTFAHPLKHLAQQGSLLSVTVFTGLHVHHEIQARVIDHQRLSWQGSAAQRAQFLQPMLARLQTVAVQHSEDIPGQPGRSRPAQLSYQGARLGRDVAHQRRGRGRLQPVELVIDRDHRHRQRMGNGLVGGID